jgi:hypothetical protein
VQTAGRSVARKKYRNVFEGWCEGLRVLFLVSSEEVFPLRIDAVGEDNAILQLEVDGASKDERVEDGLVNDRVREWQYGHRAVYEVAFGGEIVSGCCRHILIFQPFGKQTKKIIWVVRDKAKLQVGQERHSVLHFRPVALEVCVRFFQVLDRTEVYLWGFVRFRSFHLNLARLGALTVSAP